MKMAVCSEGNTRSSYVRYFGSDESWDVRGVLAIMMVAVVVVVTLKMVTLEIIITITEIMAVE